MDVLIAWLPVEEPDLTVGPTLFTDRRVLAVSADHDLARRPSTPVETLADFPHATAAGMPGYWEDAYLPSHTPQGRTIKRIQLVTYADDLINLVTTGEIIHLFPAHVTEYWSLPHIQWLPISEMPALPYGLVWRSEAENDLIRALASVVRDTGVRTM
jgi:DNA-binding transcriptional LysR family regulator